MRSVRFYQPHPEISLQDFGSAHHCIKKHTPEHFTVYVRNPHNDAPNPLIEENGITISGLKINEQTPVLVINVTLSSRSNFKETDQTFRKALTTYVLHLREVDPIMNHYIDSAVALNLMDPSKSANRAKAGYSGSNSDHGMAR